MTKQPKNRFGLNQTRIVLLIMGAFLLLITVSMMMGGLGSYNTLKEAASAANSPPVEQSVGN